MEVSLKVPWGKILEIEYSVAEFSRLREHMSESFAVGQEGLFKVELPRPQHLPCLMGVLFCRLGVCPR